MENKKFYEFKNKTEKSADLYVYGEIVGEKWYDNDVTAIDFNNQLKELGDIDELNIFMNTPGGSVFVASAICSMLQRLKDKGTIINTYVDGLCASAGTFILMLGDNINLYSNSITMIHKPISWVYGNTDDLQKEIDVLNKIQNNTMIPLYMKKAKVDEETINQLINDESWLSTDEMNEYFDVNVIEEEKQVAACVDEKLFNNYKHTPENLKKLLKNDTNCIKNKKIIDYTSYEKRLNAITK